MIDGTESDGELGPLHARGVRGVRLNLSLGVVGSAEQVEPLAQRIAPLGWHLQLLMAPDLLAALAPVLRRLPVALVFDHCGRIAPRRPDSTPRTPCCSPCCRRGARGSSSPAATS